MKILPAYVYDVDVFSQTSCPVKFGFVSGFGLFAHADRFLNKFEHTCLSDKTNYVLDIGNLQFYDDEINEVEPSELFLVSFDDDCAPFNGTQGYIYMNPVCVGKRYMSLLSRASSAVKHGIFHKGKEISIPSDCDSLYCISDHPIS